MSSIQAKVVADSVAPSGKRITTLELTYPRFIHSEMMTHRVFSRNAASSRAIPVKKTIDQVLYAPVMPLYMGQEKKGMQAGEDLPTPDWAYCYDTIMAMRITAITMCESLANHGLHKSLVNRYLEPWQEMKMIVTSTAWGNFFALRDHPDAEKHIQHLAQAMREAIEESTPKFAICHLPYVDDLIMTMEHAFKASVARCARVSYKNHDGTVPELDKDIALHDMLLASGHWSPFEHQATALPGYYDVSGNFTGWQQYRKQFPQENRESDFVYDKAC